MYAVSYDFDTDAMKIRLGPNYANGYKKFKRFMKKHGFRSQQGSLLYGEPSVGSVDAVLAIQAASRHFSWLKECVKDMRLLEVAHNDDLSGALLVR